MSASAANASDSKFESSLSFLIRIFVMYSLKQHRCFKLGSVSSTFSGLGELYGRVWSEGRERGRRNGTLIAFKGRFAEGIKQRG